jgi:hypothetical protein
MRGPRGTLQAEKNLTFFRSYSDDTFCLTPGWQRLADILTGDGGSYGLHGPAPAGQASPG